MVMQSEGKRHKNRWVFTSTLGAAAAPWALRLCYLASPQLLSLRYADQT
jgi:hypothetical protein